ncbi:MAG: tyrosine-type recombinase/integrase, partial [Verrucomicrobia subdivision 3 bacterium]|nr:tyrosine-type recombinase/integrase [Limisphaerales bacterium]
MKPTFPDVQIAPHNYRLPRDESTVSSSDEQMSAIAQASRHQSARSSSVDAIPAFGGRKHLTQLELCARITEAAEAWLAKSPSPQTRDSYGRDLQAFLIWVGISAGQLERLVSIRPHQVAAWRDHLRERGLGNAAIVRKITVLRSLFSYLQTYGYTGANPAHSDFVQAPAVPRDGKTVGLTPEDCRRLLEAPDPSTPVGIRDRAILGTLAYSACRVGELARLRVGDYREAGGHKILEVFGKGGKERRIPLHAEAFERLEAWLGVAGLRDDLDGPLFRATRSVRGQGRDGFRATPLSKRAVQALLKRYARAIGLDPAVTVHSLRVTALTTARERGADIIDLQDFAGHSDPQTTLTY